jgi:V/A-type H+-transporting ATPase subunit F
MKKIAFITPKDSEFGFLLAGVNQYVTGKEDFIPMLKSILLDPDTVLVIVDERLVRDGNEEKMKEIENAWHGILIVLPSPERPVEEIEDYASRLIRRAIGYHVRLKI